MHEREHSPVDRIPPDNLHSQLWSGIAPTKCLTKIANEIVKQDTRYQGVLDLSTLSDQEVETCLATIAIEDVWGIGHKLEDAAVEALKSLYQPVERDIDDMREQKTIAHTGTIKPLRAEKQIAGGLSFHLHPGHLISYKTHDKESDMPRDERKRQKTLMKQRSKQKVTAQHRAQQQALTPSSPQAIFRRARTYPLYECLISDNWNKKDSKGLVEVLIARKQPDDTICFGVYLIDVYCLGLKNTFANVDFSRSRYLSEIRNKIFRAGKPVECSLELAQQMIYQSIEYAEQFGFEPEKDFALSQYLLTPRGELEEPYNLTFGKDGKPFFINGPHDNVPRILRQLEKTAGTGNYDYLAMVGGDPFDDDDDDDVF